MADQIVHRGRNARETAQARAELDERLAIQTGHHYRSRLSGEILPRPQYSRALAGAELTQAETLAWVRTWPEEPLEGAELCRAGLRTWIERWDGAAWVTIEGSEIAV